VPFGSEGVEHGIGIALSGGGFRATLFHIGALWRLIELEILPKVDRISSVSGGSIVSGVLAANWLVFKSNPTVAVFRKTVVEPLRVFCRLNIDTTAIGEGLFNPWKSIGEVIEAKYAEHLLGTTSIADLPETPRFVFNATNLHTGRSFRFSKPYMGDYRIGLVQNPKVRLAKVVAASSAFPPVLSPVILDEPGIFEAVLGADLNGNSEFTRRIFLSDGGVYDNLGLETVWNRYQTILVSDAGAPFSIDAVPETDWIKQSMRALDVATDQARAMRKRALISDYERGDRQGSYWGIDTDIADYGLGDAMDCQAKIVAPLASIRTRLNPFDDQEQELLINWGYAVCDAAVRRFAPELSVTPIPKPTWPYPLHPLGD
jgi:NTE family protein